MVWQTGEIKRADSIKLPVQETRRQWMACNPGRGSHWLRKIWIQPRRSSKPLVSTGSWCRGKPSVRRWRGRSGGAGPRGGEQYTPTPWWLITSETAKSEAIGRSEARRWRNGTVCVEDKRERRSSQEGEWGKSRANGLPSTPSPIDRVSRSGQQTATGSLRQSKLTSDSKTGLTGPLPVQVKSIRSKGELHQNKIFVKIFSMM